MQRITIALLAVLVLAAAAVACSKGSPPAGSAAPAPAGGAATTPATAPDTAPDTTGGSVLMADDFTSADTNGWTVRDLGDYGNEIEDGRYIVWVDNNFAQYVTNGGFADGDFADVSIEVAATKVSGSPSAGVGIHCRRAPSGQHGSYYADVDEEGEVRIAAQGDDQDVLAEAEMPGLWQDGENHLRLACVGDEITFWVNGKRVLQVQDGRYHSGRVGLGAGGAGRGDTRVAFDDLKVSAPDASGG